LSSPVLEAKHQWLTGLDHRQTGGNSQRTGEPPSPKAGSLNTSPRGLWGGHKASKPISSKNQLFLHHRGLRYSPGPGWFGDLEQGWRGQEVQRCSRRQAAPAKTGSGVFNLMTGNSSAWQNKGSLCHLCALREMMHLVSSSVRPTSLQPPRVVCICLRVELELQTVTAQI